MGSKNKENPGERLMIHQKSKIYYAFNEDTDPFSRISKIKSHTANTNDPHFEPPQNFRYTKEFYIEEEARTKFLKTDPVSFIIFGKPGLDSFGLATKIADDWGCVLISPEILIRREIERESELGIRMTKLLRNGESIDSDIIIDLVKCRVNERDIAHKGYVIEGIPFIPDNDIFDNYFMEETAVISDVENERTGNKNHVDDVIPPQPICDASICECVVKNEIDNESRYLFEVDYERAIEQQIDEIFAKWPIKPSVITYIMCPDRDLIRKCELLRLDVETGAIVDMGLTSEHRILHVNTKEVNFCNDIYDEYGIKISGKKFLLSRIIDTANNIQEACDMYKKFALPVIDKQVLMFNPQNIIRVDGRATSTRMFEVVNTRMLILPFSRTIFPKLLVEKSETAMDNEESPVDSLEDLSEEIHEDNLFESFKNYNTISPEFLWKLSSMQLFCPVELSRGKLVKGHPQYVVQFMDKLYFLSSVKNIQLFLENPRPFLLNENISDRKKQLFNDSIEIPQSFAEELELSSVENNFHREMDDLPDFDNLEKCLDSPNYHVLSNEKARVIDIDISEKLLNSGYFLLSPFGRFCPVQLFKNENPISMYLVQFARRKIFPVIFLHYIYFLGDIDAKEKFCKNPLKFLSQDTCSPLVLPVISIIGPPKCGKTTLAERFASTYGMKVITRGSALRHVLENYPWTELARLSEAYLRLGNTAMEESVSRAIELFSIDPQSTQGYVLDGFPENLLEADCFAFLGIQPLVVLDLKANLDFCLECLSYDDCASLCTNYSPNTIAYRFKKWEEEQEIFRTWLIYFSQNSVTLDATVCKWGVWLRADRVVRSKLMAIKKYFREADLNKAHSLEHMCISMYEFRMRQSRFESFCPLCLYHDDCLISFGPSPDHRGYYQFREYFYWICPDHVTSFTMNPTKHLPPINTARLPKTRPRILRETVDENHIYWSTRVQDNGFCLVTYLDSQRNPVLKRGQSNIAVMYADRVYLFCSQECRDMFIIRPHKYSEFKINFHETPVPIPLKELSNREYLQRTVVKDVVQAVNRVIKLRPKLPGLSSSITAIVYLGVFLKIFNKNEDIDETSIYDKVLKRVKSRDAIIRDMTHRMKKIINPYVSVPNLPYFIPSKLKSIETIPVVSSQSLLKFHIDPEDRSYNYKVPAFLNVVDIAGLVKGAAEGQGLGNAFLSNISACDGIFHLCRAFEDDDVTHVEGDVNPVRDLEIISEELRLKDVEFLNGHLEKLEKLVVRGNDKKLKPEYETLLKVKTVLVDEKNHIRFADWSANDIEVLNKYLFLTSKPVIYLVNLSEKDYIRKKNKWLIKIKEWVDKNDPGAILIPFSGAFETKVVDMDEPERAQFFESTKVTSALDKIIVQGYKALQLQYFFTAGHDEVKAWTIQKGFKAPQAAGRIHTDFEKGFIMAEVMRFDDFKNEGSEAAVKAAGKYRQQGRNYVVEDGDIIFFKFNAGAGLKDAKKK